ncbi:MAG TPA: alpha/beta hydrolase [Candidatus Sulfotelmatobacter sp.]|nr:alpha/beta hydrolase [Candidatus Sulfotelmatobacter sp.]
MSTFVLVHGAWQSAGTWDLLAPLLEKNGHRVLRPVLSGLGTDGKNLSADITLRQHIKDVLAQLTAAGEPVILVGHSYAGMIISGVVEENPAQVKSLVFLDAFVPEDGQKVLDLLPADVGVYFRSVASEQGDGWRLPGGDSLLDLWGLPPGEAREFVRARLCDFTLRCFDEPLPLPTNRKASVPSIYVACMAERYPAKAIFAPFAAKVRASGGKVVEVESGHDCQAEVPEEVASVLLPVAS